MKWLLPGMPVKTPSEYPSLWDTMLNSGGMTLTREGLRERICWLQAEMERLDPEVQVAIDSIPVKHTFVNGAYAREITMPAGLLIVGKIHRHEHLNFISRGDVSVVTEEGGVERLKGPCTIVSPPGCKRVVFCHEETVWTTFHVTDAKNEADAEKEIIVDLYSEIGLTDPNIKDMPQISTSKEGTSDGKS